LLHLSTSEPQANCWNKWPYIFGLPAYILAIEFALQISGRSQRLKETLAGVSVAIHSDVSGHGVGAALLSVSVMNALRSQSLPNTDFKDPEQVLASLNSTFPSEENNDMFFTIWYGVYNKSTRELTYASGGHPPALLFENTSSGDSGATLLRTANNAIGAMTDVTYEKSKHLVGEQTTLYIFSDGVYEVEKSDGSM
jgi:sigma-B regulation protein RsbU (phosphoserine phosphatase)